MIGGRQSVLLERVEKNSERKSSYPHYTTILNIDIEIPMTLKNIGKFKQRID